MAMVNPPNLDSVMGLCLPIFILLLKLFILARFIWKACAYSSLTIRSNLSFKL